MREAWVQGRPSKILLATDLSARCDRAADRAVTLASQWQAQLVAVHSMAVTDTAADTAGIPSWRRGPDPQKVAKAKTRAEMQETLPDVTVVIDTGDPADVIVRTAEKHGCDLIVTGVARDEPLGRLILGGTVEHLVRRSHVPILVVRKRGHKPYRHVVAATDFSEPSRHAFEAAFCFFPEVKLTVFHAHDAPMPALADTSSFTQPFRDVAIAKGNAFIEQAASGLRENWPELIVEDGEPTHLLHDYAKEMDVDVMAIGSQGRNALLQALLGRVAHRMVSLLPCDVLIVREQRARAGSGEGARGA